MNESRDRNQEVARLAVARGMVTKTQADECLRASKENETLEAVLQEKGYITGIQRDVLLRELAPPQEEEQMVGGFHLIKLIGKGGMGSVYRARQVSLERIVALKVLNRSITSNPTYRERFHREARAAATFNHPNIVRAIDAGEDEGILFFAMELVDGKSVSTLLREEGIYQEGRAVEIVRQVALGLSHAWKKGVIHRDIKPENILIDRDKVVKLTDLGLAKFTGGEERRITQAGMAMGTPYYISPEQIRLQDDLDIRADIYALGATLFHMVCGRPPYVAESPTAVVSMHLSDAVPDPRSYAPGLSAEFSAVAQKMLAKDPKDRFQTPEELIQALDSLRSREGVPSLLAPVAHSPGEEEEQGIGFGMVMAVVTLMALAGLVYFLLFPLGGKEELDPGIWSIPEDPGDTESPVPTPQVKQPAPPETKRTAPRETKVENPPVKPLGPPEHEVKFREAEAFAKKNPKDYAGALQRLASIEKGYEGTTSAILASKAAERVRARLDGAARKFLHGPEEGIALKARRFKELGRFKEGLALFDGFPDSMRAGGWVSKLSAAREAYLREGKREVDIHLRRARDLVKKKKYQQALEKLRLAQELGVPGYEEKIQKESERVRRLRADRLFISFVSGLFDQSTRGGLLDAEAYLSRWAGDPDASPIKEDLKRAQEALEGVRVVLRARNKALKDRVGRAVDFRLKSGNRIIGTLKTALPREATVVLKGMSGASAPFSPKDLGIRSLFEICALRGDPGWRALASFQFFLLGNTEAALQCLDNLTGGVDPWLKRVVDLVEEEIVGDLLQAASKKRRNDPEKAHALIVKVLGEYRHSRAVSGAGARVLNLLLDSARLLGLKRPDLPARIHGKVQEMNAGRLKLTWNFRHRTQKKDLSNAGPSFRIEDGALHQTGEIEGGMVLLPLRWKRYALDGDVEVPAGREGYVGFVFHYQRPGQYYLFVIRAGARTRKVRAGLFQPVLGDRGAFVLREVHAVDVARFEFDRPHKMKLIVDGDSFRGVLDGKLMFATKIISLGEGRVGLRADRPAAFNGITIVGNTID